ncbi:sigma 54-interacting transcriptional regulator [Mangrovicoccus ximenensis]|uniref:sigma 54-interacting transcriptional regulator n=1 Tax=Mangrovicoccus ximenensis TaxID=1911570 RepID=UPI001F013607|nr:sigma 54-interacting transcriptional regulator [Mangrovicoccus ximenensis]
MAHIDLKSRHSSSGRTRGDLPALTLEAVFEIAKIMTSAADPIAEMPKVLNILSSYIGLGNGALALLSDPVAGSEGRQVNPYVIAATTRGRREEPADGGAIPTAAAKAVFRSGVPVIAWDAEEDYGPEAVPAHARGTRHTLVAVPVRETSRSPLVIGVLAAFRPHGGEMAGLTENDANVLTMVSALLEQALRFRRVVAKDRERVMNDAARALKAAKGLSADRMPAIQLDGIIGESDEIAQVIARIARVAKTRAAVLLRGESGTGKELFARAIHAQSDRAKKPFISVNCAALSETLLESELFGHEKGAFTGAGGQKKGRFELADKGTLFLDEIGEISPEFQAKLLRVLQESEFERVGGTQTVKTDFRLIAATNRDLEEAVASGKFRADLYFRICVVPIVLPPLRERPGDIKPLAELFLRQFNDQNGTAISFAPTAMDTLCACKFPGNVRELENCVNRAAALSVDDVIHADEMACKQGTCLSEELWRLQSGDASPIGGLASGQMITPRVVSGTPAAAPPAATLPSPPRCSLAAARWPGGRARPSPGFRSTRRG